MAYWGVRFGSATVGRSGISEELRGGDTARRRLSECLCSALRKLLLAKLDAG